jgi:hypothetical protein
MKIPLIYEKIKKDYPHHEFILLNGGFIDLETANTTIMELALYKVNYNYFKFERRNTKKIRKDLKNKYCVLEFKYQERIINIIVTSNKELIKKKVLKRNNEIMLNNYPLLLSQVLILMQQGHNSFKSWGLVLGLEIKDEESFLIETNILEKEAKNKTDKINKIILKSLKKIPED